jgi:hypothetical protein
MLNNIGAEIYRNWSEEQRRQEIANLLHGYKKGMPISIVCMTAEAIAGSRSGAKKHLISLMTLAERQEAISSAGSEQKEVRRLVRAVLS